MVPGECSPHHFNLVHSFGAGGPTLYSHITPSTHTLTYPLSTPFTRGGRDVFTCASSCQSSVRVGNHQKCNSVNNFSTGISGVLYLQLKVNSYRFYNVLAQNETLNFRKLTKQHGGHLLEERSLDICFCYTGILTRMSPLNATRLCFVPFLFFPLFLLDIYNDFFNQHVYKHPNSPPLIIC